MAKGVKEYSGTPHNEGTVREMVGRVSNDIFVAGIGMEG